MTLGSKIKKLRSAKGLTQKDLAERLNVTFQTISKWENGENEPDLATLRNLAKALECSIEYLVSEEDEEPSPKPVEEVAPTPALTPESPMAPRVIANCRDCGTPIHEGELSHNVERRSPGGMKENVVICDACFRRHEEEIERRAKEVEQSIAEDKSKKGGLFRKITDRDDKKPLIWAIVIGVILFAIALASCIANFESAGIAVTIVSPLLVGYTATATIYCIFTASFVSDIFLTVASWSVRFPGLIFTWSLDGFIWLIAMKLLFFVLGLLISIGTFLLALALAAAFSVFSFIPLLIYNKTHN